MFTCRLPTQNTFMKEIDRCLVTRAQHWHHQHDVGAHAVGETRSKPSKSGEDAGSGDAEPEIVVLDEQRCQTVH